MSGQGRVSGTLGELRAEQCVIQRGGEILCRNYAIQGAEIDLIARDGNTIAFIEVKLRMSTRAGLGRESVTPAKQRRICRAALHYMMRNGLMNRQARFDVIEIQGERVTYIENAFAYQGPAF